MAKSFWVKRGFRGDIRDMFCAERTIKSCLFNLLTMFLIVYFRMFTIMLWKFISSIHSSESRRPMSKKFFNLQLITLLIFLSAVTLAMGQELPTSQDYMQSAQTALQDNDLPRAIQDYLLAIKLDSRNWQAYQNLGGCYVQLGRMNEAKAAYKQSLAINPNNPVLKQFMAQVGHVNPTPTITVSLIIPFPLQTTPTPTPTFVGVLMTAPTALPLVSRAQATPTFIGVLMNTPTPMPTAVPT